MYETGSDGHRECAFHGSRRICADSIMLRHFRAGAVTSESPRSNAVGGEGVGVLDPADEPGKAEPAQVIGHLAGHVADVWQIGDQGAEALVADAGCRGEGGGDRCGAARTGPGRSSRPGRPLRSRSHSRTAGPPSGTGRQVRDLRFQPCRPLPQLVGLCLQRRQLVQVPRRTTISASRSASSARSRAFAARSPAASPGTDSSDKPSTLPH
jgi:hypothetical protein